MSVRAISADDKKWRAESDARTLADAEAIKADKARFSAAQAAAKRMLEEQETKAMAMHKVAHGAISRGTMARVKG